MLLSRAPSTVSYQSYALSPCAADTSGQAPPCSHLVSADDTHAASALHPEDPDDESLHEDDAALRDDDSGESWHGAVTNAGLTSLLVDFQSSPLGRMMSDVADHARSFFNQYDNCHSPSDADTTQAPSTIKINMAAVNRDVMFPTRTRPDAIFDDYEICGDLSNGSGAFGRVMIVRRWNSEELRACKAVRVRSAQEKELIENEIELLKSLDHPNIVELHAVYLEEVSQAPGILGKVYMVCEFCRGGDLAGRIAYHRDVLKEPMSENHVAFMMQQILSATSFCHDRGIIHRDLKPQNILFQNCSRWSPMKIIDFGLADFVSKIQETAKKVPITSESSSICAEKGGGKWLGHVPDLCSGTTGWVRKSSVRHVMQVAGTTPYMAPEVFSGWYDHRFDNFSIGIILFELLCGWHPFYIPDVDCQQSVKENILSSEPDFPSDGSCRVAFAAVDLCRGLLEKDPENRITAAEALEHPWLKDPQKPSAFGNKEDLTLSKMEGLMNYVGHDKFKRAVYTMLTTELSEQQTQELRKLFMALDVTGDGVLTPKEIMDGMLHVGLDMSKEELAKLVAALSPTGEHRIQYREFMSALVQRCKVDGAKLMECFQRIDSGGKGRISFQDVRNAVSNGEAGEPGITETEWAEVISQARVMGAVALDGELTFDEFVKIIEPSMVSSESAAAAA